PLALGHFGIDAFVVDAGCEAEIEVSVDDLAGDVAHVFVADAGVVLALRRREATARREAEWYAIIVKEVFLLETEPGVRVIMNGGAGVRWMRLAIGPHDLAHDEGAVGLGGMGVNGDGLQDAIRAVALGLPGGAAVKSPEREFGELREARVFLDLSFAAEVGDGLVTVQPD